MRKIVTKPYWQQDIEDMKGKKAYRMRKEEEEEREKELKLWLGSLASPERKCPNDVCYCTGKCKEENAD